MNTLPTPVEPQSLPDQTRGELLLPHLQPDVAIAAHQPTDYRVAFTARDLWIEHGAARAALDQLEDALAHPSVDQMPCIMVAARSRNGKTTLLKRFREIHPLFYDHDQTPNLPVLRIEMPEKPRPADFWSELLKAARVSHRPTDKVPVLKAAALNNLQDMKVRMLLIDEIHNVLRGSISEQQAFLVLLKRLTNELMIAIAVAGTQDAVRTLKSDEQFEGRFQVAPLPRWLGGSTQYRQLLASLETLMPLQRPSKLAGRDLASRIFQMSEGTIGSITKIVRAATVQAIRDGSEHITIDKLNDLDLRPLNKFREEDL